MSCLARLTGRKLKLARLAEEFLGKKFTNIVEDVRVRKGNIEVFASLGGAIYSHWSDVCNYEVAKEQERAKASVWTPRKQKLLELAENIQGSKLVKKPLDARVKNDVIELLIGSDNSDPYWVGMGGYKQALNKTGLAVAEPIPSSDILLQIAQHHCESKGRKMPEHIDEVLVNDGALVLCSNGLAVMSTIYEMAKASFDEWHANTKAKAAGVISVNWNNIVPVMFFESSASSGKNSLGVAQ